MSNLGTIIRDRLEEKGWSMRELARRSGLPAATVQKILTGDVRMPTTENVCAIASALGLPDRTLLRAAAVDGGYVAAGESSPDIQALIDGVASLSPAQRAVVAAMVEAMLRAA